MVPFSLDGTATGNDPTVVRYQGRGMIGGEEWVYDYQGFVVPDWPEGITRSMPSVGSIIRTVPHSNGQAEAGYVASWYAVRQA